jgi:transcription antitermination factor NusG
MLEAGALNFEALNDQFWTPATSHCFYVLISLIYLEEACDYERMYPRVKALVTSKHVKQYPIKDLEYAELLRVWNSKHYSRPLHH